MNQNDMSNRALLKRIIELEDKFAKLKRMYEDAINNIDENNFATSLVKKIGDMETKINISADGVTSQVSNELVESMISQKAGEIKLAVDRALDDAKTEIKVEADGIAATVEGKIKNDIDALNNNVAEYKTSLKAQMGEITSSVEAVTKSQNAATGEMEAIRTEYSNIQQTANEISSKVGMSFGNVVDCYKVNSDSEEYVSGYDESGNEIIAEMKKNKVYHYTDDNNIEKYDYFDGSKWKSVDGPSIFSCFTQTKDGFKLKGDFTSTTNEGATVDISGTRIDVYQGDDSSVPKLSMGFDEDQDFGSNTKYPFVKFGQGDGIAGNREKLTGFGLFKGQGIIYKTPNVFGIKYNDAKRGVCGIDIVSPVFVDDDGNETNVVGYTTINLTADKITFNGNPIKVTFGG